LFRAWFNGDEDFSSHGVPTCAFSCTLVLYQNLICNAIYIVYSFLEKLTLVLQTTSNPCGFFYNHCIGATDWAYRLNSYQASNWLYGFYPRVSNSHWLLSPNAVVIKSARFSWFVKKWIFCKKVNCY